MTPSQLALPLAAGLWAGIQNALAGGGSFITLPALIAFGLDARAANITSTVALFPAQIAIGATGWRLAGDTPSLSFRTLFVISLLGGAVGALLLLATPPDDFARLVPWLVLFATVTYAWGSFRPRPARALHLHPLAAGAMQGVIAVYGGYFGGGIGFLMLAALAAAGLASRAGAAIKNLLIVAINASAVAIFALSPQTHWGPALILGTGALAGGLIGGWLVRRIHERALRVLVVLIGASLTIGLFARMP